MSAAPRHAARHSFIEQRRLPAFLHAASLSLRLMYPCGYAPDTLTARTLFPSGETFHGNGLSRPSPAISTSDASYRSMQKVPAARAMSFGHPAESDAIRTVGTRTGRGRTTGRATSGAHAMTRAAAPNAIAKDATAATALFGAPIPSLKHGPYRTPGLENQRDSSESCPSPRRVGVPRSTDRTPVIEARPPMAPM